MKKVLFVLTFSFLTYVTKAADQASQIPEALRESLLKRWSEQAPKVLQSFQNLKTEEQEFVLVYRGIDRVDVAKIKLDHQNIIFNYGPYVYTSINPKIAMNYSRPSKFGKDLACDALVLEMWIPHGFFIQKNEIQYLLDTYSEFANLNLFVSRVGFESLAKRRALNTQYLFDAQVRFENLVWYSYESLTEDQGGFARSHKILSPDKKCRKSR